MYRITKKDAVRCWMMIVMEYRNGWLEKCLELGEQLRARDLIMVSI